MSSVGWQLMGAGSGEGAVLCLNFTVAGVRGQAGFADLAAQLPEGYAVWGTDESAWPSAPGLPRAQLDEWLDRASRVDAPVRAVFGFCGTAALAAVLASRLAGPGGAPAVVLFDPIVVGPQNLVDQTEDSLRQLPALAPDPDQPDSDVTTDLADGDLTVEDLADGELATRLARRYSAHASAVGAAQSIRPATVAQLCTRLETYLRYLTLCTIAWAHPRVAPDLTVLSRGYDPPGELPGTPLVRLDVTQHTLLGHPEAARAAAQVLAGALVDGRS